MLAPYPILPPLICQFIRVKAFGESPGALPFEPMENTILGTSLVYDPPCTTAFTARYSQDTLSDGFYFIRTYVSAELQFPSECIIVVLHWNLDFDDELRLTILKASVVSTIIRPYFNEPCLAARNPEVVRLLHCLKYRQMRDYEANQILSLDPSSGIQEVEDHKPDIGFSNKDISTVQEFSAERKERHKKGNQEDLLSSIIPYEQAPIEITELDLENPDFDVFPEWAIIYLRLCYNI